MGGAPGAIWLLTPGAPRSAAAPLQCLVKLEGGVQQSWSTPRLQDVAVAGPEGRFILAASSECAVRVYDWAAETAGLLEEDDTLISMSLAPGDKLLVREERRDTTCAWKENV